MHCFTELFMEMLNENYDIFQLPPELSRIHDVFHVSMLRRYRSDPSHVIKDSEVQISENLSYVEEPVRIVD